MAKSKYLAIDFGAESGRVIVGILEKGKIILEEIHRFPNKQITIDDHQHWDVYYLFEELKKGLSLAVQKGHKDIQSIGIDTWGVDFGLIGKDGKLLGLPFAYRDSRTNGMMEKVFEKMPREEVYSSTGIQFMQFNSIFQLYSASLSNRDQLDICDRLLFMPDLFNYFLTGKAVSEYTITSTSQLINAQKRKWDENIFQKLGLPLNIMPPIIKPGSIIKKLLSEVASEVGLNKKVDVVAVGCHDTASAVAAVPAQTRNWAYLSSGTWSLIGIETKKPIINDVTLSNNFTNEGGVFGTIRFLHNVMGLWLMQETRKSWQKQGEEFKYPDLIKMASEAQEFKCVVNPDDNSFLNPPDMPNAIKEYCVKTNQPIPESKGEFLRCIFESLALKYKAVFENTIRMSGSAIKQIHVVGGGSQNEMLNQFTADSTGIPVIAGPVEATALGNILVQAIAKGKIKSLKKGREIIAKSFPVKTFQPENSKKWDQVYHQIKHLFI